MDQREIIKDRAALAACAGLGLLLAVLPHLAALWSHGTFRFIADNDDLVYLASARAAYHGGWSLRDPFSGSWENVPCLYSWLQFVPLAKLTRWLGLPLILMGLVWRAAGGPFLGASLFILFRRLFARTSRPAAWALWASLICLCDAGFIQGRMLVQGLTLPPHLIRGSTPMTNPDVFGQFRVVQPLLHLPFLFLLAANFLKVGRSVLGQAAAGGLLLGTLVLLNFYFWTAAAFGLGMLLLWSLGRRETEKAAAVAGALVLGLALGAPQILGNSRMASRPEYKPILQRLEKPIKLAPADTQRRSALVNTWTLAKLAAGGAGVLALGLRGLAPLWFLALAGYLLNNLAFFTGLEFQNAHWFYIHAPLGEVMVLAVLVVMLDRRGRIGPLWLLPAALAALALTWRPYEALRAPESAEASGTIAQLEDLRSALDPGEDCSLAGGGAAGIALMYSRCAELAPPTLAQSSFIGDQEVHERHALNAWLSGARLEDYLKTAADDPMCRFSKPQWEKPAVLAARKAVFESLLAGPRPDLLERYRPTLLLLPADAPEPRRAGPWRLARRGASFSLWTRGA